MSDICSSVSATIMDQVGEPANPSPEACLAREREMLQRVESGAATHLYHLWETSRPVVVIGRSNRPEEWVDIEACRRDRIEILQRISGGGAVVLGSGCVNYAIALSLVSRPELADVGASFCLILQMIVTSLGVPGLRVALPSDLTIEDRKVSGNAQRRGRAGLLQHGTFLYDFDPDLATRYLTEPPRQPEYRRQRRHRDFLSNVPVSAATARRRLTDALAGLDRSSPNTCAS